MMYENLSIVPNKWMVKSVVNFKTDIIGTELLDVEDDGVIPMGNGGTFNISDTIFNQQIAGAQFNNSSILFPVSQPEDEYIFDRVEVRAIFITLYTMVFCCCFFGE